MSTDPAPLTAALASPSVYSTLSPEEKVTVDAALDRLDRGEGLPADEVFARLDRRIWHAAQDSRNVPPEPP